MIEPNPPDGVVAEAFRTLPSRSQDDPVFRLAWHSRVFALIVSLVREGHIPWASFQQRLIGQIRATEPGATHVSGEDIDLHYFDCWLEAAQETLQAEGFITRQAVAAQIDRIRMTVESIRTVQFAHKTSRGPMAVDVHD